ncbi:MAG TPA: ATP-binding protein [bacterium]|nr:ATP-binding protein [bacterium]
MLIEFSVSNFLSFKEKATLSMLASRDDSLPHWKVELSSSNRFSLLKAAIIYGANGSGKSNFIKALSFMRKFVIESAQKGGPESAIDVTPFKLEEPYENKPSEFEIIFIHNGVRYGYGFSVDKRRVHHEWLTSSPKGQLRKLFERSKERRGVIKFGSHWKGGGKRLMAYTRPNALFLSTAAQFNHPQARSVVTWFLHMIDILPEWPWDELYGIAGQTSSIVLSSPKDKANVLKFLERADLGIIDFIPKQRASYHDPLVPRELEEINDLINDGGYDIKIVHKGKTLKARDKRVLLDLKEESAGTKKIYNLAGPLMAILGAKGIMLADELDVRLHPNLARWIIEMFMIKRINNKNAQLIMTSHDASFLDRSLFRRDQIWFTEKDESGASRLYSLWDFKARKDENIRGGYLVGRYGAVPFLDHIHDGV